MAMASFLGVWLLCGTLLLGMRVYDLRESTEKGAADALAEAGLGPWVLAVDTPLPTPFHKFNTWGKTLDGEPVFAEQYELKLSQESGTFSRKIELIKSLAQDKRFVLPHYAFYTNKAGALVTHEGTHLHHKPSFVSIANKPLCKMSVNAYNNFTKKLMKILIELGGHNAVFLKLDPDHIAVTRRGSNPIISNIAHILSTKYHCIIDDIHNSPTGRFPNKPHWVVSAAKDALSAAKDAWSAVFPKPITPLPLAKTPQEDFKLRCAAKSSNTDIPYILDNLSNMYYVVRSEENWNIISFVTLLKEQSLPQASGSELSAFAEMLDRLYAELEKGNADKITWKEVDDLLALLPSVPRKQTRKGGYSSDSEASSSRL